MNKRTILLVALVVLSMVGAANANGAATAGDDYAILADAQDHDIVSIADVTLQPGTTTTVPIMLLNSTGVGGIAVTLTFNSSIVTVTTGVAGVFDSNASLDYSNVSDGVIRVTGVTYGTDLTGDLTIATVTLEAVGASGSCELGLSAEMSNKSGGDVLPTMNNGTFTISTTVVGDINGDNKVDYIDLGILGATYGLSIGAAGYNADADLNGDNTVNYVDLGMLGAHYGESI